jgi:5-methylcytosine-specific restriction endonuclease McrA
MKFAFCVACLATDDLQHHHLVTREEGGSDDEANLLTLCSSCGDKLHQRRMNGTFNDNFRTRRGQRRLKGEAS